MSGSIPAINASGYTQKMKGVATNERHGCLLWRLPVPYQRMRTRTGVKKMNAIKELVKCKSCDEKIDPTEHECDYCEDCCYDLQMSWQKES
jgi:hypothetical protein